MDFQIDKRAIYVVRAGERIYGPFDGYSDPAARDFIASLPRPWNRRAMVQKVEEPWAPLFPEA